MNDQLVVEADGSGALEAPGEGSGELLPMLFGGWGVQGGVAGVDDLLPLDSSQKEEAAEHVGARVVVFKRVDLVERLYYFPLGDERVFLEDAHHFLDPTGSPLGAMNHLVLSFSLNVEGELTGTAVLQVLEGGVELPLPVEF